MNRDIYQAITERFIEQLKRGTVPWQKPWFAVQNIVSRKPYRGINALLLGSTDYQSPFWISFKQALELGGHVKKGEKSTPGHLLQDPRKAGRSRERDHAARTAGPLAFRSSGGRMFSISTRPKASRRPRSQPVRARHSRSKRRPPSLKMPGSAPSTTRDLLPAIRPRMT